MSDNEAGQALSWTDQGRAARAGLAETWGSLSEVCHALVTGEWELPTACPGWTVKDQLSHLIGIEQMIMGIGPPEIDQPPGDHVKNDFAALNEKWIAARRPWSGESVLAEFNQVTATRLGHLDALGEEEWATVGYSPVGEVPYARFMGTRLFDSWVHEQDVRRALDRPGGVGGLASAFGVGQVEAAMGFVVGKKAAAPEGTVVRFVIGGEPGDAREFAVAVEGGRARPVTDDRPATVTLELPALDFLRLGCGRVTAEEVEAAAGIGMAGDSALGERVLSVMNFMF